MADSDQSRALKRSRFPDGWPLTPADLEREQKYVREKLKRHNRSLHGFGIVSGLKVTINSGRIVVEPGLALDCEGNELVIETPQSVVLPSALSSSNASSSDASSSNASLSGVSSSDVSSAVGWHTAYLSVRFVEEGAETVCDNETAQAANAAVLTESFELEVAGENYNRGHRHLRARWLACGQPHALTIAKLRHRSQGWSVDRGYRPPSVK